MPHKEEPHGKLEKIPWGSLIPNVLYCGKTSLICNNLRYFTVIYDNLS